MHFLSLPPTEGWTGVSQTLPFSPQLGADSESALFLVFLTTFLVYLKCYLWRLQNCFFLLPHLFPKQAMPLHVRTMFLSLRLLMIYFNLALSKKCFFPRLESLIHFLFRFSSWKQRLILDLWQVNAFVYKQRFKREGSSVASQIFDENFIYSNLFSIGISSHWNFTWATAIPRISLGFWQRCFQIFLILCPSIWPVLRSIYFYQDSLAAWKVLEISKHLYCHFSERWSRRKIDQVSV